MKAAIQAEGFSSYVRSQSSGSLIIEPLVLWSYDVAGFRRARMAGLRVADLQPAWPPRL
jgi:hypothetical protein